MSTTTAYHGTFLLSIFLIVCFLELVALTLELYWLVSFLRAIARERSPITQTCPTYDAWIIRGSWLSKICQQCSLLLLFWQKNKQALRKSMTFVMCTFQAETSRIVYAYSIYSTSVSTGWVYLFSIQINAAHSQDSGKSNPAGIKLWTNSYTQSERTSNNRLALTPSNQASCAFCMHWWTQNVSGNYI